MTFPHRSTPPNTLQSSRTAGKSPPCTRVRSFVCCCAIDPRDPRTRARARASSGDVLCALAGWLFGRPATRSQAKPSLTHNITLKKNLIRHHAPPSVCACARVCVCTNNIVHSVLCTGDYVVERMVCGARVFRCARPQHSMPCLARLGCQSETHVHCGHKCAACVCMCVCVRACVCESEPATTSTRAHIVCACAGGGQRAANIHTHTHTRPGLLAGLRLVLPSTKTTTTSILFELDLVAKPLEAAATATVPVVCRRSGRALDARAQLAVCAQQL